MYEYIPVLPREGQSRLRLIVSSQSVNDAEHPVVLGLQIREHDPGGLLNVRIEDFGWAPVLTIEAVLRRRLGRLVGAASANEMDALFTEYARQVARWFSDLDTPG